MKDRVSELVAEYLDLLSAGSAPPLDVFLKRHPDWAAALGPLLETAEILRGSTVRFIPSKAFTESFPRVREAFLKAQQQFAAASGILAKRSMQVDQRPDLLILLLATAGEVWGITRLTKLLFLMGQEGQAASFVPDYYHHVAYNFGPFEETIGKDLDALERGGLVEENVPRDPDRNPDEEIDEGVLSNKVSAVYKLTENGLRIAQELGRGADEENPNIRANIVEIVGKYAKMPLRQLLKDIYTRYPDFAKNSKIRDEILGGEE